MDGSDGDERVDERMERCFNLLATSECSKQEGETGRSMAEYVDRVTS